MSRTGTPFVAGAASQAGYLPGPPRRLLASHPARCAECKTNVEVLLRKLFGDVRPGWSSGWPCQLQDVAPLKAGPGLCAIHAGCVRKHRVISPIFGPGSCRVNT